MTLDTSWIDRTPPLKSQGTTCNQCYFLRCRFKLLTKPVMFILILNKYDKHVWITCSNLSNSKICCPYFSWYPWLSWCHVYLSRWGFLLITLFLIFDPYIWLTLRSPFRLEIDKLHSVMVLSLTNKQYLKLLIVGFSINSRIENNFLFKIFVQVSRP